MGSGFDIVEVDKLGSAPNDMDNFSGAIVLATEKGSGLDGYPVNFAGAWGRRLTTRALISTTKAQSRAIATKRRTKLEFTMVSRFGIV